MDEGLTAIAAFIAAIVGLFAFLFRVLQFFCGLGWLFSRGYRERVAKDHPACRWFVHEGVFYVLVVVVLALVAIGGVLVAKFAHQ